MGISRDETGLITEMVFDYADILVKNDPLSFSDQTFNMTIFDSVYAIINLQIKSIYDTCIEDELVNIVDESLQIFFDCVYPARSRPQTCIVRSPNIGNIKNKLDYLTSIPQPDQRTEEWFKVRHNYLTASNIWKAFSTEGSRNQLIYSKCIPVDTSKYDSFNLESPLHWGQKYEAVSLEWYEREYKTRVGEFGCIPHPTIAFLAASPDGINTDCLSSRYGRMVEVKNIVNRDITGIPKTEYWIQMQMQMEVCNLDECDFLETRFTEYDDNESFVNDGTFTTSQDGKIKGIMMLFLDSNGRPVYEYAEIGIVESSFYEWNDAIMEKNKKLSWLKNIYWKLDEVSVVLVDRNKFWFDAAVPVLIDLWKTIEQERQSGCSHRAPKKRHRTAYEAEILIPKCLIEMPNEILTMPSTI